MILTEKSGCTLTMTTMKTNTVATVTLATPTWTGEVLKGGLYHHSHILNRLDYAVPEQVKKFLQYFQDMIKVNS